jgi:glycosyltransferase involved in cell wall biosynthesis
MSIADVFTSLMGIGDMRSASVLQASAAGGVPIVNESPEHNEMVRQGFTGFLVQPGDSEGVVHAISLALDPDRAAEVRSRNQKYIALHEDRSVQLQKMLHLINTVCGRYAGTVRGRPS